MRLQHTIVGWDMFDEVVNLCIQRGLPSVVTQERVDAFVARLSFTSLVERTLKEVLGSAKTAFIKNADSDVAKIKEFLRIRLGTTFTAVTVPSQANSLDLDLVALGAGQDSRRMQPNLPWIRIQHYLQEMISVPMFERS